MSPFPTTFSNFAGAVYNTYAGDILNAAKDVCHQATAAVQEANALHDDLTGLKNDLAELKNESHFSMYCAGFSNASSRIRLMKRLKA